MDFIQGFDRNQLIMMDFESNVAFDSWARVVDWFVDALPMKKLGFNNLLQTDGDCLKKAVPKMEGTKGQLHQVCG